MNTHKFQPRQPQGRPTGGEWTEGALDGSGLTLDTPAPRMDDDMLTARREALANAGYVPGVATTAVAAPEVTDRRDEWWETHFIQAEHDNTGGYPKMPDDYTPTRSGGHAL